MRIMIAYIIILFFLTVLFTFILLLQLFFNPNKRLEKRLKRYLKVQGNKKVDTKQLNLFVQLRLTKQKIKNQVLTIDKNKQLKTMLESAGVPITPEEYTLYQWILSALSAGLLFLLTGSLLVPIIGLFIGFQLPRLWIKKKQKDRIAKFNEGLPDMLTTIIGSLRAGFSFNQSIQTVAEESQFPIKEEMEAMLREIQYGSNIDEALVRLKERVPSEDLDLMVQAVMIQRQIGGNLAVILEKIVITIRERTKVQRQISTLTAQGKLSGIIIGLLPIILGLVLYMIEPDYMLVLFSHPIGIIMVSSGGITALIGLFLIRKITTIEV